MFHINKNGESGFTSYNFTHRLSADFAVNRKVTYGAAFEMYSTGIAPEFSLYKANTVVGNNYYGNNLLEYNYEGYGVLNVKGLSLYRYKYKKGIAPLGKHSILGLKLLFASTDLSNLEYSASYYTNSSSSSQTEDIYDLSSSEISTMQVGFTWGYGVNRIISDKVTIRLGVESTLFPLKLFAVFKGVDNEDYYLDKASSISTTKELFTKQSIKRMTQVEMFNITLGIGFLAY
jgi:opacity protein-like surface antigen